MAKFREITATELRQLLKYEPKTGRILWRHRTADLFSNRSGRAEGMSKYWNSRYAGKETMLNGPEHGYRFQPIKGLHMTAHHAAWALYYGEYCDAEIDHINGVKSDNRIDNLRSCTKSQNMANVGKRSGTSSSYKGVSWHKRYNKWTVAARIHLGNFDSEEDAAKAYDKAVSKIHGEFARLNFPKGKDAQTK